MIIKGKITRLYVSGLFVMEWCSVKLRRLHVALVRTGFKPLVSPKQFRETAHGKQVAQSKSALMQAPVVNAMLHFHTVLCTV